MNKLLAILATTGILTTVVLLTQEAFTEDYYVYHIKMDGKRLVIINPEEIKDLKKCRYDVVRAWCVTYEKHDGSKFIGYYDLHTSAPLAGYELLDNESNGESVTIKLTGRNENAKSYSM